MVLRYWWLTLSFLAACFSPQFQDGQIMCGPNDECPPGLTCSGGLCRSDSSGIDASSTFPLTVVLGGNAMGTVKSSPPGIDCGTDCTEQFTAGAMVTLTATPDVDSTFVGWSGACSGTGTCTITIATAVTVTANFAVDNTLVVALAGNGSGIVSSNPPGISCGSDCSEQFTPSTTVVLTASPATGSTFEGWSGGGCSGTDTCTVTTDAAMMVTATFSLTQHVLTVVPAGNGSGTVASTPAGIDCGSDCDESIPYDTMVTLTAMPDTGSTFTGWSGGGCTGTGTCTVTMTAATTVTATFTLTTHTLTVTKTGNGNGNVTSVPAGITCGSDCNETYDYGTMVTLSATPATGSTFAGWSGGGCTGTSSCTVPMTMATTVTANFTLNAYQLSVTKTGNGTGTVTATGIDCGTDCTETVNYNTMVTLSAVAGTGSTFTGWSGGGCTGTTTCTVTVTAATTVTATFALTTHTLTVTKTGTGAGTITGLGINCGPDCSETVDYNTMVTLTATASPGSSFDGWSGGGCNGTGTCTVSVTAATSVVASFTLSTHQLSVTKVGTGSGTVTSTPAGINCGIDCNEVYNYGTTVTLHAAPSAGSNFTGWSGAGCSGISDCVVSVTAATSVTATFTLTTQTLTVTKTGAGTGTVTSNLAGINCGTDCTEPYNYGTVVTLTAVADAGSIFSGWSGGTCTGTGTCDVTLTAATTVTANFIVGSNSMTVTKAGTGAGTVTSMPAGINCGSDCSENFSNGTMVTLTAVPAAGSTFTGWSGGGCMGTSTCTVTISAAVTITATFTLTVHTLSVNKTGNGAGTVTSNPAGISCGLDCAESYNYGTSVVLTAVPAAGSTFAGWSGGGCTGTGTCTVAVTAATTVTATFNLIQYDLTIKPLGTGSGTVTSNPTGIDCGADCDEAYNNGQMVTLTATPAPGSVFAGWDGDCLSAGTSTTCMLTMDAAKTAIATFDITQRTLSINYVGTPDKSGIVTLDPPNIDCSDSCSHNYDYGSLVTLSASPAAGWTFVGWSGGGCTGTGKCDVTMTAAVTVTATFQVTQYALNVNRAGTGSGNVTSSPTGINCGTDCTENYDDGTGVQLTATPSTGSNFTSWSGCNSTSGNVCNVTMSSIKNVTATFTVQTYAINLSKSGPGSGTVTSAPNGISCGPTCISASAPFPYNTMVTLTAAPSAGSSFTGWSGTGGCSGTGTCTLTMTAAKNVTATFATIPPNYMFITKTLYNGKLGGLSGADAVCQSAASAASLPGTYVAWLSSTTVNAASRLTSGGGPARGWIRTDGKPFADTVADITAGHLFYPPRLDEYGNDVGTVGSIWTATLANGTYASSYGSCADWTSASNTDKAMYGLPHANSSLFTSYTSTFCDRTIHLMCFGVDRQAVVSPPNASYRRAFTTTAQWDPSTGIAEADALCNDEATAASLPGTYRALLATTTASALSRFTTTSPALPWARTDNTRMAATAAGIATSPLDASPNTNAANNTAYGAVFIATGAADLVSVGTDTTTCKNWSSNSSALTYRTGYAGSSSHAMWWNLTSPTCVTKSRLVCLQE